MKTKIYGSSDDLVEIDGQIRDEYNNYSDAHSGFNFSCSDGTKGRISYNGEWIIRIAEQGDKFLDLIDNVGDDADHTHEDCIGCTSYSDVLILDEGIEWVKIGREKFKP